VILAVAAALAIVVQDHTPLRAAPRSSAPELTRLWQGELLEIRGESAGYRKVYDYHLERGGYLRTEAVHPVALTQADAPQLLAVLRFLRDTPGSEALGISYGAAYLRAIPATALNAEPLDAVARMAERLADQASGGGPHVAEATAHLDVVAQFGIHTITVDQNGRMRVCYDGEMYRRVLALPGAPAEERAHAALAVTRPDCVDLDLSPLLRASIDKEHAKLLDGIANYGLSAMTSTRLRLRRATTWAAIAYEQARAGASPAAAATRALDELLAAQAGDLGDDGRAEYLDALVRVSAIRWAATPLTSQTGPLVLTAAPGAAGQTCLGLSARDRQEVPLVRRCTYGIVWLASMQTIAQGRALVLAVQPLPSWRELWVFRETAGGWRIDVLSPGAENPEAGYVDYAGFAPTTRRLLIAREARERGGFRRRFEELRLDDLASVRQASTPDLLLDFRRWQDNQWRRDTLALH
jgi:hypothetical protein